MTVSRPRPPGWTWSPSSDAGALPLNGQVVVLQEHGVPLLVLVLRLPCHSLGPWAVVV